jgi:hypothetical protein
MTINTGHHSDAVVRQSKSLKSGQQDKGLRQVYDVIVWGDKFSETL